ncbi:type VI secretion system Vgr family protein [Burkholderia plantarii]|uniref:type VI secretion system Vgr family protein n=1 Tax=Burkholderia plantarii TaxID=41899 RepID=UPI0038574D79
MDIQSIMSALRGGLLQQDRLLKLDTTLPADTLIVSRAIGHARLGRDVEWTLDVVSTVGNLELKALIAQPVTLWIQQGDGGYRPVQGYVLVARRLGSDGAMTLYQLRFTSALHFLHYRRDERYWQDQAADAIITDVLNRHPQLQGRFRFELSRKLPARSYCRQHETDWNFVHRMMESEGLYCYWEYAPDGSSQTMVIVDALYATPAPFDVWFQRQGTHAEADALGHWAGSRMLQSAHHTTRTFDYKNPSTPYNPKGTTLPTRADQGELPQQLEVYEYTGAYAYAEHERGESLSQIQVEEWESRAKRFHGSGAVRAIDAGRRFMLNGHPEHDRDRAQQREFVAIDVRWTIQNNVAIPDFRFPHSLAEAPEFARAASGGQAQPVAHADGSTGFYHVDIEAQRTTIPYRSPLEHEKPEMHLETATVVGPSGEEVYTDDLNRVKVRFHWDRQNDGDERASCWLRVAQSDSGSGYGGVHLPRVGEEVGVGYFGGDCDRPIVLFRVFNGKTRPQWHSNGILSGFRSKEYAGSGFNELVLDDATGQNRAKLASSIGSTALHLGYLIDQQGNVRGNYLGSGFDLRTDHYGAVRANRGLYVTTHAKSATSQPLDAGETQRQLESAGSLMDTLSQAGVEHHAEGLDSGRAALKTLLDATRLDAAGAALGGRTAGGGTGNANAFAEPVMVFGSPAGIGLSTQQAAQIHADRQVNLVSGESTHIAAGKSLIASVAQKLSLFVQSAGMKLFAGKGKVEIQAHSDNIELTAQQTVKVLSSGAGVEVAAKDGILLTSGNAYIRIKDGNIEIHAPGKVDVKGAEHLFAGPQGTNYPLPPLPQGELIGKQSLRFATFGADQLADDIGWTDKPYQIANAAGEVLAAGQVGADGRLPRTLVDAAQTLVLKVGTGKWETHEVVAETPGAEPPAGTTTGTTGTTAASASTPATTTTTTTTGAAGAAPGMSSSPTGSPAPPPATADGADDADGAERTNTDAALSPQDDPYFLPAEQQEGQFIDSQHLAALLTPAVLAQVSEGEQ